MIVIGDVSARFTQGLSSDLVYFALCDNFFPAFRRGLSSDLVYCILFPQLCMVVHFKHHCNTYGSLAGYIVGLLVRLSGGEEVMKIPPLIHYPGKKYPLSFSRHLAVVYYCLSSSFSDKKWHIFNFLYYTVNKHTDGRVWTHRQTDACLFTV